MAVEVVLPKVDMDMETGVIAAWRVAEGDVVRQGDVLFEMETDKALMDVEAPGSGRIRGLAPVDGEPIAVGTPVAWIDVADEGDAVAESVSASSGVPEVAPAARSVAAIAPASPIAADADERTQAVGIRATPLARATARESGIALEAVAGSGPRGRIGAADVAQHHARAASQPSPADDDRLVPFDPVRRTIAQRLAQSVREAPHFFMTAHVDMGALVAALDAHRAAAATTTRASVTAALVYLVSRTLVDHPMLNASVDGDAARLHRHAHIGIAMDRDGDLVVPVIRRAASRTFDDTVRELGRLRAAIASHALAPSELRGATFTISNLGMYGVDAFTAIINPPESAILAVGRIVDTPVGRDGRVVLRPMATLTLSADHRIIDGTAAARFMADLRRAIEDARSLA